MPPIAIICAERSRRSAIEELCTDYLRRLERYRITVTLEEWSGSGSHTTAQLVAEQSAWVQRRLRPDDCLIVLDERGEQLSSPDFARLLEQLLSSCRRIVFIIGGAYGISDALRGRAHRILSLGSMTLPHELARVVLCEQLYRALTILRGEPYHHG